MDDSPLHELLWKVDAALDLREQVSRHEARLATIEEYVRGQERAGGVWSGRAWQVGIIIFVAIAVAAGIKLWP